jgi:hypothetical protein
MGSRPSASPGVGWGAYAKPFSAYYVPGPVPNDPVTSTAGSDFFLFSFSANNNNGAYTNNPTGYGAGAGADVYVRWPFTLASNLSQRSTFVPNTTISAYSPNQYSQGGSNINRLSSAVVSYASSPGANLKDAGFAAALRAINIQSAPWLAPQSQSTSVSTPSAIE